MSRRIDRQVSLHATELAPIDRSGFLAAWHAERKSRGTALALSLFLGGLGVDRFYLGQPVLGAAKLLFGWATCGLWPLLDVLLIMPAVDHHNRRLLRRLRRLFPV